MSEEIKPVAYLAKNRLTGSKTVSLMELEKHIFENIPIYTKQQLQPRVKMTKAQHDRLMWDKQNTDLSTCLVYFLKHDGNVRFGLTAENLMGSLTQEDIARAWLNPDETIEIVPEMKWFVRSKEKQNNGKYTYMEVGNYKTPDYDQNNIRFADKFDTKEEAEPWTNPLTEAVQLPVEGDND